MDNVRGYIIQEKNYILLLKSHINKIIFVIQHSYKIIMFILCLSTLEFKGSATSERTNFTTILL